MRSVRNSVLNRRDIGQVRVVGEWAKGNNESKPITRHMLGSFMAQKRQRTLPKNIFNLLSLFAHAQTHNVNVVATLVVASLP